MKLLVVGSRSIKDSKIVYGYLDIFIKKRNIEELISGGANGVDTIAKQYANDRNIPFKEFIPDWSIGKHAGFIRNEVMFKECDVCIGFWDGESKGTKHNIKLSKKYNKPLYMHNLKLSRLEYYNNGTILYANL